MKSGSRETIRRLLQWPKWDAMVTARLVVVGVVREDPIQNVSWKQNQQNLLMG